MHCFKYALLFAIALRLLSATSEAQDDVKVLLQTKWQVSTAEQQDANGDVRTPYSQEAAKRWKWDFNNGKMTWTDGPEPRPKTAECTYTVSPVQTPNEPNMIDIKYVKASFLLNGHTSKGIFTISRTENGHKLKLRFYTDPDNQRGCPRSFDFEDGANCTTLYLNEVRK